MFQRRDDIDAHDVADLYESGLTASEIADKYATSKSLILARLDEAGVERRPQGWKRPEFRFWRKVDKNGPTLSSGLGQCWQWTGETVNEDGFLPYGRFWLNGTHVYAHRFAWELQHGPIPDSLRVCHHCDNPRCVRGSHLWIGTQADNIHDRDRKGRQCKGADMPAAKLSEQEASTIRWSREVGGLSIPLLARWYEVGQTTISNIIHGRTWKQTEAA